jgi:hypothetical protein
MRRDPQCLLLTALGYAKVTTVQYRRLPWRRGDPG